MGMVLAPKNYQNFIVELSSVRDRERWRYFLPHALRGISVAPVASVTKYRVTSMSGPVNS